MLRKRFVIDVKEHKDFEEIESYCNQSDFQIRRLDLSFCEVIATPKQICELTEFVKDKQDRDLKILVF